MKFSTQSRSSSLIINIIWYVTFENDCSPAFYRVAILKNFKIHKNLMEAFFKIKAFKSPFSLLKTVR